MDSIICLGFVNTVESRMMSATGETVFRLDRFREYEDLTAWCVEVKILSQKEAANLNKLSRQEPLEAEYLRRRAIALREAIYQLCLSLLKRKPIQAQELSVLNEELAKSLSNYVVATEGKKLKLDWAGNEKKLERMLWVVAKSAADFLSGGDLSRLRQCGGENCGKLFFDTSRNGRRAWCDMKTCGNLAKVRRFRSKQKTQIK
jgi:predicted RNA-binding Zn ribbon-like protein